MKEKKFEVSVLLDYYAPVLTEKQREVLEFYYNEDLSLSEIAEHELITRQGVRDNIKRGETVLFELETALGFAKKNAELQEKIEQMRRLIFEIQSVNRKKLFSDEIFKKTNDLLRLSEEMLEL